MKTMLTLCMLVVACEVFASLPYYSASTLQKFSNPKLQAKELREEIFHLSSQSHRPTLTYTEARRAMFGNLFLKSEGDHYYIQDVYCNIKIDEHQGVGPNNIPNQKVLNCEHTWPQSKFSADFPKEWQKTDLHHMFPSDMKANSTRNNHPFAEVNGKITHNKCPDSKIGTALDGSPGDLAEAKSFEPPFEHRGNVARAIYYFSTRYKVPVDSTEAHYLKIWNAEDPVDEDEALRNEKIMQIQGNRNPFVDYPELINRL